MVLATMAQGQSLDDALSEELLMPPEKVPAGGTFWSWQLPEQPPLPYNPFPNAPVYFVEVDTFLFDDRRVDYDALRAEQQLLLELQAASLGISVDELLYGSYRTTSASYAAGTAPHLLNTAGALQADQTVTASFDIAGGSINVPYDILLTTNLTDALPSWTWIGVGYTSNRYTFTNQPTKRAFYALGKPNKTMTVGWGRNDDGECDVPFGLTNVVSVAGGAGHSIGLLTDGTVVPWGDDFYQGSVPPDVFDVKMISAGWFHNVALLSKGVVKAWGYSLPTWHVTDVPPDLTNAIVVASQAYHSLALRDDGTVVAWGYNNSGQTNVPAGLSDVVAIAAGLEHSLAVTSDGTVVAWGGNSSGQCTVPAGLSEVHDVAAGLYHSLALRTDGTVVAWGANTFGETDVPTGLTNVVAISAGGLLNTNCSYSLALKNDGTVVKWGSGGVMPSVEGLNNVIALSGGALHALAIRSGPPTPVITIVPEDQYQLTGGTVTFTSQGRGIYGVGYQWQFEGVDIQDATNASLTLNNVQSQDEGAYRVVVSNEAGTLTSPEAQCYLVTVPVLLSKSPSTDPVFYHRTEQSLGVELSSVGQSNGFPLTYLWEFEGTNIDGADGDTYEFSTYSPGTYSVTASNAAGTVDASWDVTIDYNTLDYYLTTNLAAHTNGRVGFIWSGFVQNHTNATGWTWMTNGFLTGLRGASAISAANDVELTPVANGTRITGTALTRRHVYVRGHQLGALSDRVTTNLNLIGKTYWFVDTNNVATNVTVADNRVCHPFNNEDWGILFLASDLPPTVETMRCIKDGQRSPGSWAIPGNVWNKLPLNTPWPIFATCQHNQLNGSQGFPLFQDHWVWHGGDSGSPHMLLLANELVFLHGTTTFGVTSLMLSNMDEMTMVAGLSTNDYQPQFVDLSAWPNLR